MRRALLRLRLPLTGLPLAGVVLLAAPAAAQTPGPEATRRAPADLSRFVLDLEPSVLDLQLTVESLDGSTAETESADAVDLTLAADVFFAFDAAELQPAAGPVLADVAAQLRQEASGRVEVVGHTDAVGTAAYNLDLSQRRAASVVAALGPLLQGTDVELVAEGRGATEPVAQERGENGEDDPEGRARNRRVTITFAKS